MDAPKEFTTVTAENQLGETMVEGVAATLAIFRGVHQPPPRKLLLYQREDVLRDTENIRSVIDGDVDEKVAAVDKGIRDKQTELLEAGNDQSLIDEIGDAIMSLREERQSILTEAALKHDLQDRIEDLISFLDAQTEAVTEYSEPLARRLIEKITVYDEKLVVEFKSGLTVEVEA